MPDSMVNDQVDTLRSLLEQMQSKIAHSGGDPGAGSKSRTSNNKRTTSERGESQEYKASASSSMPSYTPTKADANSLVLTESFMQAPQSSSYRDSPQQRHHVDVNSIASLNRGHPPRGVNSKSASLLQQSLSSELHDTYDNDEEEKSQQGYNSSRRVGFQPTMQNQSQSQHSQQQSPSLSKAGDMFITNGAIPPPNYVPKALLQAPPSAASKPQHSHPRVNSSNGLSSTTVPKVSASPQRSGGRSQSVSVNNNHSSVNSSKESLDAVPTSASKGDERKSSTAGASLWQRLRKGTSKEENNAPPKPSRTEGISLTTSSGKEETDTKE